MKGVPCWSLNDQNHTTYRLSVDSGFSSLGKEHLTSYQVAFGLQAVTGMGAVAPIDAMPLGKQIFDLV